MWIDDLDFDKAIKEIMEDSKQYRDFCLDPLRFEDIGSSSAKKKVGDFLREKLRSEHYIASPLIEIDIPKSNHTLRPGARPQLYDNIVYHAIVGYIFKKVYRKVPKENYHFQSYLDYSHGGLNHWKEFENKSRELANRYEYVISTDIVGFFEHVNHLKLKETLLLLNPGDTDFKKAINFLVNSLLNAWYNNSDIKGFGLPQGPKASSILGDIYLTHFGDKLKERKIPFVHYVDDVRLFANSIRDCKIYMKEIVVILRDLKLNLNSKKTRIFTRTDLHKLFDPNAPLLEEIDNLHRINTEESFSLAKEKLEELYLLSIENKDFGDRYLRKYLSSITLRLEYRIIDQNDYDNFISMILDLIENSADLTPRVVPMLRALANNGKGKDISRAIQKFIHSKSNIYEWQEMLLLDALRQLIRLGLCKLTEKQFIKLKLRYSGSAHTLCKEQIYLIAGIISHDNTLAELLRLLRANNIGIEEKRVVLLSLQKTEIPGELYHHQYFKDYLTGIMGAGDGKFGFTSTYKSKSFDRSNWVEIGNDFDYYSSR